MQKSLDISRRSFLQAAGTAAAARAAGSASHPNILFLMTDQHRADCLGAAGNRVIRTPNLDRLAADGVHFRHAYSSTPTCTPARAALLTGQSPWTHGMLGYGDVAPQYPVEMPRLLREAGYHTVGIGKMHWTPQRALHGFHRTILDESTPLDFDPDTPRAAASTANFRTDYESWFFSQAPDLNPFATGLLWNDYRARPFALPEALHPTTWTGETAVRFLNSYRRPEPFFLKVSFLRPHSPYDPPERFLRMYDGAPIPSAQTGSWAARFATRSDPSNQPWHGDFGSAQVRQSRQAYYGSISLVDEQIGHILETLDRRGMMDNTLILMAADHGDMLGDHHLWRKSYGYEASARIPMMVRWPDGLLSAKRGQRIERPVEIRDIVPTFLDAAGTRAPEAVEGRSLLNLIRNPQCDWREFIDLEHDVCYSPENHWNGLTDGRRKFIFHARTGAEQFFDLDADPNELNDLAANPERADEVRLWRSRLTHHLASRGNTWVAQGRLALRPGSQLYSPNYPGGLPVRHRE
jgi:arylsulfatase A-like enzyme